jgi:hypothetical protein
MPAMRTDPMPWSSPLRAALTLALARLDEAELGAQPHAMAQAHTQLGRCYRDLGEIDVAAHCLRQGLRWAVMLGADMQLELHCELAETVLDASDDADDEQHARALREQARDHCFEASRLCRHSADPQWEVTVLLRVSDVLDRCGDHDDAIALQCRALQLIAHAAGAAD